MCFVIALDRLEGTGSVPGATVERWYNYGGTMAEPLETFWWWVFCEKSY